MMDGVPFVDSQGRAFNKNGATDIEKKLLQRIFILCTISSFLHSWKQDTTIIYLFTNMYKEKYFTN